MSDHPFEQGVSPFQVAVRVVMSCALTAFVVLGSFLIIRYVAG
jgi:hypothetical protein